MLSNFKKRIVGMRFAFFILAMLCALSQSSGCLVTNELPFDPVDNFPPSLSAPESSEFQLGGIIRIDHADAEPADGVIPIPLRVRDINVDQVLLYLPLLTDPADGGQGRPLDNEIDIPVELGASFEEAQVRDFTVNIPFSDLRGEDFLGSELVGRCLLLEIIVSSDLPFRTQPRRPAEEGDIDRAVFWVNVVDSSKGIDIVDSSSCPTLLSLSPAIPAAM